MFFPIYTVSGLVGGIIVGTVLSFLIGIGHTSSNSHCVRIPDSTEICQFLAFFSTVITSSSIGIGLDLGAFLKG